MLLKTTKKAIRETHASDKILSIGYCDAQYLLYYVDRFAYSAGVYGWSCDYYMINDVIISTGYSPIGLSVDHELLKKYNDKASKIVNDYNRDYESRKNEVKKLLNDFINEVVK